jgi:hypothetical protein
MVSFFSNSVSTVLHNGLTEVNDIIFQKLQCQHLGFKNNILSSNSVSA